MLRLSIQGPALIRTGQKWLVHFFFILSPVYFPPKICRPSSFLAYIECPLRRSQLYKMTVKLPVASLKPRVEAARVEMYVVPDGTYYSVPALAVGSVLPVRPELAAQKMAPSVALPRDSPMAAKLSAFAGHNHVQHLVGHSRKSARHFANARFFVTGRYFAAIAVPLAHYNNHGTVRMRKLRVDTRYMWAQRPEQVRKRVRKQVRVGQYT